MKQIKNLGVVLLLFIILLVLVVIRTSNQNLFKQDSQHAIEVATKNSISISMTDLEKLSTPYLVVDLRNADNYNAAQFQNSINIPFENLLDKTNRKILNKEKDKIVLFSDTISTSSKAWVILNQLDFDNVYILQNEKNNEVFKYKFQSDTTAKLE